MRTRPLFILVVISSFTLAHSSVQAQVWNPNTLPVCFELRLGPWTPATGTAAQFSTPPDTVKLLSDSTSAQSLAGWKLATPAIHHIYPNGRERALWQALDTTSFRVLWSDGFTGADLRLFKGTGSYFGIIRALSDAIAPEALTPKATVVANQVQCKA
jgi:hypothetical protein